MQHILDEINAHIQTAQKMPELAQTIQKAALLAIQTLKNGNKILICGNGGSAADAQHIAAELTGRYKRERRGLSAIALTTDTSALTAIGNDYGYDFVFSRQNDSSFLLPPRPCNRCSLVLLFRHRQLLPEFVPVCSWR